MLDRVLAYVQSVLSGEVKGDAAVGRYLMDALGPSTEDLEKGEFNSHLQVGTPQTLLPRSVLIRSTGYPHGLLPREPRPFASRSIGAARAGEGVIVFFVSCILGKRAVLAA